MFRNPAKLTYLNTFFFSLLMFFGLEYLITRTRKRILAFFAYLYMLGGIILYMWPNILGDRGLVFGRNDYTVLITIRKLLQK